LDLRPAAHTAVNRRRDVRVSRGYGVEVDLTFLLPPAVGTARALARGELLAAGLSMAVGRTLRVEIATDYAELTRKATSGEAHLVWAPAMACAHLTGARSMYRVVRHGRNQYRSAIVARRDGHVSLASLMGLRAAWVDRLSLGGYLLALEHLEALGVDVSGTLAEEHFHGSHPAALAALLAGDADVSAISVGSEDEDDIAAAIALHVGRAGPDHLRALAITRAVPSDALVLSSALAEDEAEEIRARLFPDPDGGRGASALCLAMEAEGFVRTWPSEYADLLPLDALARRSLSSA